MKQRKPHPGHVLNEEYELTAVPRLKRRSTFSVSIVWLGFPMILTGSITGSILTMQLGFVKAMVVMVIANLILFGYVGGLGVLSTTTGCNFALMADRVFGRRGYMLVSGLLATTVLGWFAVQTGITAKLISHTYPLDYLSTTIFAGLFYIAVTFVGIRGLHWISMISAPFFIVVGAWVTVDSLSGTTFESVWNYPGNQHARRLSIGAGLSAALALWIDAGTMAGDFNRWAVDRKSSLTATFCAFPLANLTAMTTGAVTIAALGLPDPAPFESDNLFGYLTEKNVGWVRVAAIVFLLCNIGSCCTHTLYNSATSWARITRLPMRPLTWILGILGILVAAANIWSYFIDWLSLLGILVPPIGTVILLDHSLNRRHRPAESEWNVAALTAWLIGAITALIVKETAPHWCTALSSAFAAAAGYWLMTFRVPSSAKQT